MRRYMLISRLIYPLVLAAGGLLSSCSTVPPTQEMSDARQAIKAARELDAAEYFPFSLYCAERHLQIAEQELKLNGADYSYARFSALAAKEAALQAHEIAKALRNARQSLEQADQVGHLWRDSRAVLARAEQAAREGDAQTALRLAGQARSQGENALNQAHLEYAKYLLREIEHKYPRGLADSRHVRILQQARVEISHSRGAEARRILSNLAHILSIPILPPPRND